MTPERLFLHYTFPCAKLRWRSGKITEDQMRRISQMFGNNEDPDRGLLKDCFPDAYREMRLLAQKHDRKTWDLDNVQDYWRNNHFGLSPVDKLYVLDRHSEVEVFLKAGFDGKTYGMLCINMFNLSLLTGDVVYTHQRWIIEKV